MYAKSSLLHKDMHINSIKSNLKGGKCLTKYLLRFFIFLCPLLLSFTLVYANETPDPLLFLSDELTPLTTSIQTKDQIYIPLRAVGELLDFNISFDPEERIISASYKGDTFIYKSKLNSQTFNNTPISLDIFIHNNITYVDTKVFFPLFGFSVDYDQTLFISTYLGQILLEFDYLDKPILVDSYDDIPVTSILINETKPAIYYSDGYFGTKIVEGFYEGENLFVTFSPYTLIPCPPDYNTLSNPYIINFDHVALTLPLAPDFSYDYLISPDNYIHSSDLSLFYSKLDRGEIYLAEISTSNGQITALKQLYTP